MVLFKLPHCKESCWNCRIYFDFRYPQDKDRAFYQWTDDMIRLVFALRRQSHLTRSEFQDYWLNQHAPLVASFATDLNILRYVQTHTIDSPMNAAAKKARGKMEPLYDGIAELWWSSEAELVEQMSSGSGKAAKAGAALLEDESTFIDLPNSPLWFAYEYLKSIQLLSTSRRSQKTTFFAYFSRCVSRQGCRRKRLRHYWLTHHGPIVRSHAEATGTLCYRQVHRANSPLDIEVQKRAAPRLNPISVTRKLG